MKALGRFAAPARQMARRRLPLPLVVVLLLAGACRRAPVDQLPAGTLWAGEAAPARALLATLQRIEGTPIARAARDWDRRLAGCERFLAHCPAGSSSCKLLDSLSCQPDGTLARLADEARGEASWLWVTADERQRLAIWGNAEEGGDWRMHARLRGGGGEPPAAWTALLPAGRAAAAPVLAENRALLHLRLRSDRGFTDLAKGQGAKWASELYGLGGELFAAMSLEGTTEVAVYEPVPHQMIPPLTLAVHVRQKKSAERAVEALIASTNARWGSTRTSWQLGPYGGACLLDLNVLPGLAPCYVMTERAVVLGWNPVAVAAGLSAPPARPPEATPAAEAAATLTLHFDRFVFADARLREAWHNESAKAPIYPWALAAVAGGKRSGAYEAELRLLTARAKSPAESPTKGPAPAEGTR